MSRPADRYLSLDTQILPDGRTVYKSAIPKAVAANPLTDTSIPATDTARMDVIANNIYGSAQEWWRIASANRKVNGGMYLSPGQQLIIPRG